jgi:thiamine-monophosphate kinase
MDEFSLIDRIRRRVERTDAAVEIGIGDDAAALHLGAGRRLLATTDALVERVHFDPDAESPETIGRRAVAANVSDVAAMGGTPRWILVSLIAPPETDPAWIEALHAGLAAAADRVDARIVGGNLARGSERAVTLTLLGECQGPPLRRSGARPGDTLVVTGPLGASAAGRLAGPDPQTPEARAARGRYLDPPVRIDAARILARTASAAIDISDGLLADLGHLADASGVSLRIDLHRIPVAFGHPSRDGRPDPDLALGGGEDYEIVAAIPPDHLKLASRLAAADRVGFYPIGEVLPGTPPGELFGAEADGRERPLPRSGWRHFE